MGYCQPNSSRRPNVCGTLPHFLPGSRHHFSFLSFLALIHHQEHHWKVTMPRITTSWHRMGCQDNKSRTQTPPRVRSVFLGGARACSSLGPCRSPRARRCTPPRACSILLGCTRTPPWARSLRARAYSSSQDSPEKQPLPSLAETKTRLCFRGAVLPQWEQRGARRARDQQTNPHRI